MSVRISLVLSALLALPAGMWAKTQKQVVAPVQGQHKGNEFRYRGYRFDIGEVASKLVHVRKAKPSMAAMVTSAATG